MALMPQDIDELLESTKTLVERWMKMKIIFQKAFSGSPITSEQESAFMQLKSDISRIYRGVGKKLPKGLLFEGDKMIEMLKNAMTIEHITRQPLTERTQILATWHNVYVRMTRTLGALEMMKAGYYPSLHRKLLK